ncbi:helix-turn-helix transcriptional regulator [Acetobacter fallax]|uniref:Helix-turn-helix transcriptional regulator n=1 Tax=Acetobacter fallax TaxID=1737473 RepID=A0ABX0K7Y5_9PROT|nr:helix-turn-helix transcriptional regulator [Acetobacter fallax]NHO32356.1 helix-turn-helix transcriptional regulator [Acetobacter fallax]NHO35976.1 helix-turn-helix transcriptional regulator [Acetobacter fallax]
MTGVTSPDSAVSRHERQAAALWRTIDLIAAERGLSPSGLARASGLDATAFNPSKRRTPDGRSRLPRMETILHLLDAAGLSFSTFVDLFDGDRTTAVPFPPSPAQTSASAVTVIRMIRFSRLRLPDLFDRAFLPTGRIAEGRWTEIASPATRSGPHDYAIRLDSEACEPVFRQGSLLLIAPASSVRNGDRVLIHAPERSDAPHRERAVFPPPMLAIVVHWTQEQRMVTPLTTMNETIALSPDDDRIIVQRIMVATL